jgi:thioredoxin-like negative regulator of GroEL
VSAICIVALLQTTLFVTGANTYAEAREESIETGKPMFILIGAEWCNPCQELKKNVIPQVEKKGLLGRVAFAKIDTDKDKELAKSLGGGGAIPQLLMLRKTGDGWGRRKLVGLQSVSEVEKFIKEGVEAAEESSSAKPDDAAKTSVKEQIIELPAPPEEKVASKK